MTHLSKTVLATVAVLALAACQSGGGQNALPVSSDAQRGTDALAVQSVSIPRAAPSGVRTYVHLPLRNSAELDKLIEQQSTKGSPLYHHWITPAQFRASYGPRAEDLRAAATALQGYGFTTTLTSQGVIADAPQTTVERTFGVQLARRVRGARGPAMLTANRVPAVPAALSHLGASIAAFAPLQTMQPNHLRLRSLQPQNRYSDVGPYWFDDLKQAYEYPSFTVANGAGRTIAILAAGDFLDSDTALYFGHEKLAPPTVVRRAVDGGAPPFDPNSGLSAEASLDVQQAGGSAPGAKIVVYQAPDASIVPSFFDMYAAIVEDNDADVASSSFSLCELFFGAAYNGGQDFTFLFQAFHDLFRQGNAQGITFVNASGDRGALSCTNVAGTVATFGVDFPNNDPDVTGVGGTNLVTSFIPGSLRSTYVRENAFADPLAPAPGVPSGSIFGSGGGRSVFIGKPAFQFLVNTHSSTRAVPDLSLQMGGCPIGAQTPCKHDKSAAILVLGGQFFGAIGTSVSAPEFAGLQAVQDERLGGRAGNANFLIYGLAALGTIGNGPVFHNHIPGNNGYPSGPPYNFVVGNGTVRGAQYALDPFGPFAGDPQTPSNP